MGVLLIVLLTAPEGSGENNFSQSDPVSPDGARPRFSLKQGKVRQDACKREEGGWGWGDFHLMLPRIPQERSTEDVYEVYQAVSLRITTQRFIDVAGHCPRNSFSFFFRIMDSLAKVVLVKDPLLSKGGEIN